MEQLQGYIDALARTGWVITAASAVAILAITAAVARLTRRFLRRVLEGNGERDLPSSSIFVNIARAAVWIAGVCIMLSTCFHVDVSAAIAALGIGGIAISLGFQDTLSNLIGGLQVSLLRIIKPGDNIEVGASAGVVKDVTWRHTTIRNGAGEEVLIPNSIISKNALTHLPPANRASIAVVVICEGRRLDEAASAIERAAGEAAAAVGKLAKEPRLSFSEITAQGYAGSISFSMADAAAAGRAADAVLRAVAPLTRPGGPERAQGVPEEARRQAGEAGGRRAEGPQKPRPRPRTAARRTHGLGFRARRGRALRSGKGGRS